MANISSWNKTNKTDVCKNCPEVYNKLQKTYPYYRDGDAEQGSLWCADIDVAVNETRKLWSLSYHCGKKRKDLVAIIALTCIFCFMPILFYVGAKLHSDVRERKNGEESLETHSIIHY